MMKTSSVFDEYKFIELIGRGGNAEVWKAQHVFTKHMVAIKITKNQSACKDIVKEFTALMKFDSINIVRPDVFFYKSKANAFMIMQLYEEDLFSYIEKRDRLDEKTLQKIARDVCSAIKLLHDADFVHRDIKPENVFMDGNTCVLGDFGGVEHIDNMTIDRIVGTSSFLAPEVVLGVIRRDEAVFTLGKPVDVYALGQTLYLAATKQHAVAPTSSIRKIVRTVAEVDMEPLIDALDRSEDFKDLLRGLVEYHAIKRLTIDEVIGHSFMNRHFV